MDVKSPKNRTGIWEFYQEIAQENYFEMTLVAAIFDVQSFLLLNKVKLRSRTFAVKCVLPLV